MRVQLVHVRLFATPGTIARQAPLPMGFFRQEYWSGLPFPPPGDLSNSGIEPVSPASPELAGTMRNSGPVFKELKNFFLKKKEKEKTSSLRKRKENPIGSHRE